MVLTTPDALRRQQKKAALLIAGPPTRVAAVRDLEIDGAAGKLKARHYAPPRGDGAPLLVYFHGGGFVFGDLDTHDSPCRVLCRHGGMHVLAVDYRLAPENPFPAPVEDARAALRWAQQHAVELGADPTRVGVGGDSAGANLSAAVSQLAASNTVVLRRFDSLIHGFVNMVGVSPACRDAVIEIAGATRALFAMGATNAHKSSSGIKADAPAKPGASPS
jgi:acetyl esterase